MPISLEDGLLRQVRDVLRQHVPECEVWVFGSRANNGAKRFADLDLAIVSPVALSARRLALLSNAFEESDLPIKVDLVDWGASNSEFRTQIAEHHEVIFQPEQSVLREYT